MKFHSKRMRRGLSAIEVIVSATLLVATIGIVSPLTFRIGSIWTSNRHYRLALNELANHLEALTLLDESQCEQAIKDLKPSQGVANSLQDVKLHGELFKDDDGTCLVLAINWNRGANATPLTLVGWLADRKGETP
jgi:hypothetical protein